MAKAAKNPKRKSLPKKTRAPNDTRLIKECVIYAQSIAAHRDGFRADPDGDMCHAAALGDRHNSRAWQALNFIADTPATTPDGLSSKARIVPIVFEDNEGGCLDDREIELVKSFAIEVKKFLTPICDGRVLLQKPAPEGGTP